MCDCEETIDILEINNGVKVIIHYNSDLEPVLIQYMDDSKCFNKNFAPKYELAFEEIGRFDITEEDLKTKDFDLTNIIETDEFKRPSH